MNFLNFILIKTSNAASCWQFISGDDKIMENLGRCYFLAPGLPHENIIKQEDEEGEIQKQKK